MDIKISVAESLAGLLFNTPLKPEHFFEELKDKKPFQVLQLISARAIVYSYDYLVGVYDGYCYIDSKIVVVNSSGRTGIEFEYDEENEIFKAKKPKMIVGLDFSREVGYGDYTSLRTIHEQMETRLNQYRREISQGRIISPYPPIIDGGVGGGVGGGT